MPLTPAPPPFRPLSRPALGFGVLFGTGIVAAQTLSTTSFSGWWAALGFACVLFAGAFVWGKARLVSPTKLLLTIAVGLAAFSLGGMRMSSWQHRLPNDIAFLAAAADSSETAGGSASVTLWGHISSPPEDLDYGTRFVMEVDSAARSHESITVVGAIQVLLGYPRYGDPVVYPALRTGDRIELTGDLRPVPEKRNPADFNYGSYLERRGIYGTVALYDANSIAFLGPDATVLERLTTRARRHVRSTIERHVRSEDHRAVLFALLLADRSGIDSGTRETFVETGLMHLLAVSGLHVLLVGLLLYQLLKPILGRFGFSWRRIEVLRAAVTILVLLLYLLLTGGTVSVQRAVIMTTVWIGATLLQRNTDALNALGVAGVFILLVRPAALFDVGFQLSFSAVGALILLSPVIRQALPASWSERRFVAPLFGMTVATVAATLGTAPALLFYFGRVPLAGLLLNLVAIPSTTVALLGAILCVVFSWIPVVADSFAAVSELGAATLLQTSQTGAAYLGWATVDGFVRESWMMVGLISLLFAVAFSLRTRLRWILVIASLTCMATGLWLGILAGENRPRLDVVFLDVGQGDATLIGFPGGNYMLVDAGIKDPYTDQGLRTVLPHLRRFGIDRLDTIVLTHADADHYGGVFALMEHIDIGRIVYNGHQKDSDLWLSALATADSLSIPLQIVQAGDTLNLDPSARVRVLNPSSLPPPSADGNDASVVLRLEYGNTSFLLTGDAEYGAESTMVSQYDSLLVSTAVKVPHHGSSTSSIPEFVAAASDTTTQYAVVSVARRNRYGLPDEGPISRWTAVTSNVLLTSIEGAIWLTSDGFSVTRINWR